MKVELDTFLITLFVPQDHPVDTIRKVLNRKRFQKQLQQFNANQPNFNAAGGSLGGFNYSQIPGITNVAGNPGMTVVVNWPMNKK